VSVRSALPEPDDVASIHRALLTQPFVRPAALIALLSSATVAAFCGGVTVGDAADMDGKPSAPAQAATAGAALPDAAQVATAQAIVTRCSAADSDAVGLTELQEACPGLEHALVELGYAPFISEQQAEELTVHGLVDLQELTRRYREPPQAEIVPDVARLAPVLDSLQQQRRAQAPQGWIARFKQWLRDLFEQQANQKSGDTWFKRWWSEHSLSERWVNIITYGLIGMVLLLAVTVMVNEIRAGWIKGSVRRRGQLADAVALPEMAKPTLADLDAVVPELRPALMLRVLVNTLVDAGRLRADRSLTHRELSARASFDSTDQRDGFRHIAGLGERLLYGAVPASVEEIDAAVTRGRTLQLQLAVPALPPAPSRTSQPAGVDSAASNLWHQSSQPQAQPRRGPEGGP